MAVISADGLSLLVGDGSGSEVFSGLKGAIITRLEITQRGHVTNAVTGDAWQAVVGTSNRHAVIECEAHATDDAPALRIKSLAMSGMAGNFKLQLRATETLLLSALVINYREDSAAGEIKRMRFRLESSGAASLI